MAVTVWSIVEALYKLGLEENDYLAAAKDRGLLTREELLLVGKDMGNVDCCSNGLYLAPRNDHITIRLDQFWRDISWRFSASPMAR
jgi:hypothetical protein